MRKVDIRSMVESVVREVIQTMKMEKEKEKVGKVLFIFCDSTAHEAFADQFIRLKNANIGYDLLFLDGETSSWLGMQRVESTGSERIIAADDYSPAAIELAKDYDGIIIPEIDIDNAARVVQGLKGTIKSEVIFSALVLGKFILIGADTPGIKRADRRVLNTLNLPLPLKKRYEEYVKFMTGLEIVFKPQINFADSILQRFQQKINEKKALKGSGGEAAAVESGNTQDISRENVIFSKKLLTPDWIQAQVHFPNCTVYLKQGTIISPLAKDLLKEKKLTVKFFKRDE
ncbi:hypothetical protein [Neobacillus mesonae]|nr:hypothetical protein [Neobacillus mesonae]